MSGSTRAITLTLSVRDADTVKRQLESIGPAGEQALQRLEVAAQRAAGRSGSGGGMGGLGQMIGQAGFQIQDFAVQVQSGTNALTALSQQGSQLLGVFGTGGAIAGAALTVGLLAYQILGVGENAEDARKRAEAAFKGMTEAAQTTRDVLAEINALFRSANENAAITANAALAHNRELALQQQSIAVQEQEGAVVELGVARRELAQQEARASAMLNQRLTSLAGRQAAAQGRLAEFMAPFEEQTRQDLFRATERVAGLEATIARAGRRAGELGEAIARLDRAGTFDPNLPSPPREPDGGAEDFDGRRATEAARSAATAAQRNAALMERTRRERDQLISSLDEEAAANIRLEESLKRIAEARRRGLLTEEEATRYSQLARSRREQDIVRANDKSALDREALKETEALTRDVGNTFTSAFEEAIVKGNDLRKVLNGVAEDLARIILRQSVVNPLGNAATGLINAGARAVSGMFGGGTGGYTAEASGVGMVKSALGNAFANGRLIPFASGGMVDRATVVPMALMGEAGPEAIMPLRRGKDGKLGVAAQGSGGGGVVNNFTIDARGADPSVVPLIRAGVEEAVRRSQAEFLASIQRGGQAAKIVGRRS